MTPLPLRYKLIQQSHSFISPLNNILCHECPIAKFTRLSFPSSNTKSSVIFELLHIDIWGEYKTLTHNGHHFFLTIVDDYNIVTWILLLHNKSKAIKRLEIFITVVMNQFQTTIKTIRSDNGMEFLSSKFKSLIQTLGITHQPTCSNTLNRIHWLK